MPSSDGNHNGGIHLERAFTSTTNNLIANTALPVPLEVSDIICSYLDQNSLANLCLASRDTREACLSGLWKRIYVFDFGYRRQRIISKTTGQLAGHQIVPNSTESLGPIMEAFTKNILDIQSLTTSSVTMLQLLTKSPCKSLRELNFHPFSYFVNTTWEDTQDFEMFQESLRNIPMALVPAIERHQRLSRVSLELNGRTPHLNMMAVIDALATLSELRELTFGATAHAVTNRAQGVETMIFKLLSGCPKLLQLNILEMPWVDDPDTPFVLLKPITSDLTDLNLSGTLILDNGVALSSVLKVCPRLESFVFPRHSDGPLLDAVHKAIREFQLPIRRVPLLASLITRGNLPLDKYNEIVESLTRLNL
ncbi:hypothetical protein EMPS_00072 [Entomortierella parvispora]|uniref:F-box domain-containing protein n=1 Tax=Entomortierella parvispora TaxID=205924 RepID=A0A9P3GZ42_9FUNG|nr:hypothetical protein EMPS_00072 [Entomortierella parvispora]